MASNLKAGINYLKRGEGPALVMVHGLFGSRENLAGIARLLASEFTVYSIDLPNHGRSAHVDSFSLASMAQSLLAWMADIGLERAHYFGHSLGGKAAMELALTEPERVDKLVVADIAPVAYGHRHERVFEGLLALDLDNLRSRVEADRALQSDVADAPVRSFLLKNLQTSAQGRFEWRMNLKAIHQNYADLISENVSASFSRPTLFLKAQHSDYIRPEHRELILQRFPSAALKVVSNTGHWLHAEKPDLVARLTRRFLTD